MAGFQSIVYFGIMLMTPLAQLVLQSFFPDTSYNVRFAPATASSCELGDHWKSKNGSSMLHIRFPSLSNMCRPSSSTQTARYSSRGSHARSLMSIFETFLLHRISPSSFSTVTLPPTADATAIMVPLWLHTTLLAEPVLALQIVFPDESTNNTPLFVASAIRFLKGLHDMSFISSILDSTILPSSTFMISSSSGPNKPPFRKLVAIILPSGLQ